MEQDNTQRIHKLYDLAVSQRDYPLQTLLHWFIDEQVEEEDIVGDILEKLKLIGDSGPNLFMLDQEMGQRSPQAP
jgi:ferritin